MQKAIPIAISIILAAIFFQCKKDDNNPKASLTAGPATLTVGPAAGTVVFNIVSNQSWEITSNQSWLSFSNTKGSNDAIITISYSENRGIARSASITISGGGISQNIQFEQGLGFQAIPSVAFDPLSALKGIFTMEIESSVNWKLNISDSSWLRCPQRTGVAGNVNLTFTKRLNFGASERSSQIQFLNDQNQLIKQFTVRQSNHVQANLLMLKNWKVHREIKTNYVTNFLISDKVITNPCETDDWVVIKEDSITLHSGPIKCKPEDQTQTFLVNFNSAYSEVRLFTGNQEDAYQILKLTTDSLIIENIPPFAADSVKAKRSLYRVP